MTTAADRYINRLLRRRRPKTFAPNQDEAVLARTAITLLSARPGYDSPNPEFIDQLRRRITEQNPDEIPTQRAAAVPVAGRRRFLAAGALTATGGVVGVAADRLLGDLPATAPAASPAPRDTQLVPVTGIWQSVAASTAVPEGAVLPFDLGAVTGFVRRSSGRVQAVSGFCTHQGCRLDLDAPRTTLTCPCHGATFTVAGQNLTRPADMGHQLPALPRLPVREQDGQIQVYAPAPEPGWAESGQVVDIHP